MADSSEGRLDFDTDGTLAADSDTRIPSQKAVKTYVDANAGATTTASPKPLYHGQPASTGTDAYTVPAATTARILHIRCLNPDTASHTLDLYRYASGGSASDATRVTEKITIPASSSFEADVYLPMNTGDVLRAVADVSSKVTLYLGGDEITSALTEMPAPLYHGQPAAAGGAVYTVPAATTAIVRHLRCVNADTASHTLILYRYASGGSASDATRVTETITIPASSSWEDDVYLPMNAGDVLNAKADADSKVTLFVGGDEI